MKCWFMGMGEKANPASAMHCGRRVTRDYEILLKIAAYSMSYIGSDYFWGKQTRATGRSRLGERSVSERRRWPRYKVDWSFIVRSGGNRVSKGVLRDISAGGLFGYTGTSLALGTSVEVSIKFPLGRGSWMGYSAEVIRVESRDRKSGIAFRLESPRPLSTGGGVSKKASPPGGVLSRE